MSYDNYKTSLKLTPVNGAQANDRHNEQWLSEKNNPLSNISAAKNVNTEPTNPSIHEVSELIVQQQSNGYSLLTESGTTILSDGEIIKLGELMLQVSIIKEEVAQAPVVQQTNEANINDVVLDDIWELNSNDIPPQNNTLLTSLNTNQPSNQDPLAFLYNNHADNQLNHTPPSVDLHQGLHINTQQGYVPTNSHQSIMPMANSPTEQESGNGNILHDLGINEQIHSPKLDRAAATTQPTSYATQSPLDMLDELLSDNSGETYNQAPIQNFDGYAVETPESSENKNIIDTFKNVIGRTNK